MGAFQIIQKVQMEASLEAGNATFRWKQFLRLVMHSPRACITLHLVSNSFHSFTILMHKPQVAQDDLKMAPTQPMTVLYDRTNRSLNNFRERPLVRRRRFRFGRSQALAWGWDVWN